MIHAMTRYYFLLITLLLGQLSCLGKNLSVRPEDFDGNNASEKIEKALAAIKANGGGTIVFKDSPRYLIDEAIKLPSNTKMIVDGCTIKLADNVFDNIIRSDNMVIDEERPYEYVKELSQGHDIHVIGKNGAKIEGSDNFYSGVNPKTGKFEVWDGDFWGWRNFSILFSNVKHFTIKGFSLSKTHSWGIVMTNGCQYGRVSDIELHTTVKNGDGISVIQGGSDIRIENISGETSDDSIVFAAFDESRWSNEKYVYPLLPVRYSDYSYGADIHDIVCKNVHVSGTYHVIIFLPSRPQIYDVRCENISDGKKGGKNHVVRFYGNGQYGKGFKPGNVHDIHLKNIRSNHAHSAIEQLAPIFDCTFKRIRQNNPKGVRIRKTGLEESKAPDITKHITLPKAGLYRIYADVERLDPENLKPGTLVPTRKATLQIGQRRKTSRIISDMDHYTGHCLGIFNLSENEDIKIWLPEKVRLDSLRIEKYEDFPAPGNVLSYQPRIIPNPSHPRLWVTKDNISQVRERLDKGENAEIWEIVRKKASNPYPYSAAYDLEEYRDTELEDAVLAKAFYYLMTKDTDVGEECVRIMNDYLHVVEYGNVRRGDVTRDIGKTIYTAALTLDWCHDLLDQDEKVFFHDKMMELARIMELGWLPFKENVVNGHASEAQVNRDLLSMAISFYEMDPEPYKYVSYLMEEKIIPMRAFEYQSPRHNQGHDYGAYRHGWEMRAAWILRRMAGDDVFKDNISDLRKYWMHMRLPGGDRFCDGDRFGRENDQFPETLLLDYSYSRDGVLKGLFFNRNGWERAKRNPVLFLLVNDPGLKAEAPDNLPHSLDYGDILGGMSTRTNWDLSATSDAVCSDIRGGGYHFGNHQHSDAGSFQIFHHGRLLTDIGVYMAYGTPYDFNFYKRSISHNTVLVKDPDEPLAPRTKQNDGGCRFNQQTPTSPEETQRDPRFNYGKVLSVAFSPDSLNPDFSYFKAELGPAYSEKIKSYKRRYCFMDLKQDKIPAAVIISDDITTNGDFPCYWKVNSLTSPENTAFGIRVSNSLEGLKGNAYITDISPESARHKFEISNVRDSSSVLGPQYQIRYPSPDASAYQIVEYSEDNARKQQFLNLVQVTEGEEKPLEWKCEKGEGIYTVTISDRIVCLSENAESVSAPFAFEVSGNFSEYKVSLNDLLPGNWEVTNQENGESRNFKVSDRNNSIYFKAIPGKYKVVFVG